MYQASTAPSSHPPLSGKEELRKETSQQMMTHNTSASDTNTQLRAVHQKGRSAGLSNAAATVAARMMTLPPSTQPPGLSARPGGAPAIASSSCSSSTRTQAPTRRRPYRRTKRPKDYCDKSTVTTTTPTLLQYSQHPHSHPYQAVLAEAQDLLSAATEAQQLGRLPMASTYLLLAHARLVGLGKRFDKATPSTNNHNNNNNHNNASSSSSPPSAAAAQENDTTLNHTTTEPDGPSTHPAKMSNQTQPRVAAIRAHPDRETTAPLPTGAPAPGPPSASSTTPLSQARAPTTHHSRPRDPPSAAEWTPKSQAARVLASMLPSHIELDTAMMEHLAQAAAELQAARRRRSTPRRRPEPDGHTGLLEPHDFLARTTAHHHHHHSSLGLGPPEARRGIAWDTAEVVQLQQAMSQGTKDPRKLAEQLQGRSEQQVRAYLRNQTERARVQADLALLPEATVGSRPVTTPAAAAPPTTHSPLSDKKRPAAGRSHPDDDATTPESPPKKGGRGRKPVTTAIHTVPHAICDARTLLLQAKLV